MRVCASPRCNRMTPPKRGAGPPAEYCTQACKERTAKRRQRDRVLAEQNAAAHPAPVFATDRVVVREQTDLNGDLMYAVNGRSLEFVTHSRTTVDRDIRATLEKGETMDSVVKFVPDGHEPRTSLTDRGAWVKGYERARQ